MKSAETMLDMARRHVAEAEGHVRRQREIVAHLEALKLSTATAQALLDEFVQTLEDHRRSLERICDEQRRGLRDEDGALRLGQVGALVGKN